jgi:hypothetical protein
MEAFVCLKTVFGNFIIVKLELSDTKTNNMYNVLTSRRRIMQHSIPHFNYAYKDGEFFHSYNDAVTYVQSNRQSLIDEMILKYQSKISKYLKSIDRVKQSINKKVRFVDATN